MQKVKSNGENSELVLLAFQCCFLIAFFEQRRQRRRLIKVRFTGAPHAAAPG